MRLRIAILLALLALPLQLKLWAKDDVNTSSTAANVPIERGADRNVLLYLPETQILGLQLYVNKALETSPSVIGARLQVMSAEAAEEETRSITRPHANAYINNAYRQNNVVKTWAYSTYYNATISQPLWHWNALENQKNIAKIQRQLADNDYDQARRSLVLAIRQSYLNLVLQKLALKQGEIGYNRQRDHLRVSEGQAKRGEISSDVLAGEKFDMETTEVAWDRQQQGFNRALRDFAVLNGVPSISAESLPDEIPGVSPAAIALFSPQTPAVETKRVPLALASADAAVKTAKLNLDITRVRMRPMVDLTLSVDQGQTSGVDQTAVTTYYGGVSVSWNIFDGFATRAAVRQARVTVRQSEKALEEARQALVRQLADGAADIALSVRELKIAEERFGRTLENQWLNEKLVKSGQISADDFQARKAAVDNERNALFGVRGRMILQLAAQELTRQQALKPSSEIPFP